MKFKKWEEERMSQRSDDTKHVYLIDTHFQFNEYSWLTIALSGSPDEEKEINRLLLLNRVFPVSQVRASSSNSLIVISDISFSFGNSKHWCIFFVSDILVSTHIRIAQAAFTSSKLTWLLFSTECSVIMIALEFKLCPGLWILFLNSVSSIRDPLTIEGHMDHVVTGFVTGSWAKESNVVLSLYVVGIVEAHSKGVSLT